ncbi:MAG: NUDIX domain-containing protein [Puniceicoccales bacterium]|jgi:8-oxo-dGTP diphosphatase|nr:NUDIX domain-containing protein [Puniceicoccales bacterium]
MQTDPALKALPFKISVLVFIKDSIGRHLLIQRRKSPNKDCWSPVGGKLEMFIGESPFECAVRETGEETGLRLDGTDLHLFGMISERGYEGSGHWLMFLFDCHKKLDTLPAEMDEGRFGFFHRAEVDALALPPSDHTLVWPVYDKYRHSFLAYRAECDPAKKLAMVIEESHTSPHLARA